MLSDPVNIVYAHTETLGAGQTFTSIWYDLHGFAGISALIDGIQTVTSGRVEWSNDAVNVRFVSAFVTAQIPSSMTGGAGSFVSPTLSRYVRLVVENGGTAQVAPDFLAQLVLLWASPDAVSAGGGGGGGGLTNAELRASPVPVSGPLTDAQLRAAPVPVSGTVTVTEPLSVDDNGGSLTTDGTFDERYSGGKSSFATTVSASGDTTLVTPPVGQSVRVVWVSAIANPDNNNANRVRFKFGAGGSPFYESYAVAHWEVFQGAVDVPLLLNLQTAEPVSITVHYRFI